MDDVIDPKEELMITSFVTGIDMQSLQLGSYEMTHEQVDQVGKLVKKRLMGIPLEQVIGEVEFLGVSIGVTSDVLIPRPETEILVEKALAEMDHGEGCVLDLCAGSGCMGLAIKKARFDLDVTLSDISKKALKVAQQNAEKNELEVQFAQGNLFEGVQGLRFDFLFCNPPYISEKAFFGLDKSVKAHEPKLALTGGEDGLMFYRMIEKEANKYLNAKAKCFFEIGYDQGASVIEIFSDPVWGSKRVLKDYAGHDRFFFLEFLPENEVK